MARSAGHAASGGVRRLPAWDESLGPLKRRFVEALGWLLLLAAVLLAAALVSYHRDDPSLDTAVAGPTHNILGEDGAVLADLLRQMFGLAAFLMPIVMLGWSLRLMLNRLVASVGRKLLLVPVLLLLAALALSIFGGETAGIAGRGWQWLLARYGIGFAALPISMTASACVGLLLLLMLDLSWRDWRDLGGSAGRGAHAAAGLTHRLLRRSARTADHGIGTSAGAPTPLAVVTPPSRRGEPVLGRTATPENLRRDRSPDAAERGRIVRFVSPRTVAGVPGRRAGDERQQTLDLVPDAAPRLPAVDLLSEPPLVRTETVNEEALEKNARLLETVLEDYGVRGKIVQVRPGPVVTLYELEPAPGIKASRIIGLADDIARSMSAVSVRVAVVPGRSVLGIELPNRKAEIVYLRELLESPAYEKHAGRLPLVLGKDISGEPVLTDLAKMPHLLIAGTTGSGKSVGINTMILSILYRMPPDRCKFIMVDPKMLELSVYDGIPHLLAPVVTNPRKAVLALKWTVREMEDRYRKMSKLGVRNVEGFNARLADARAKGESLIRKVQTGFDPETGEPIFEPQPFDASELPLIIVVVDEMADLMLVAGKDIEAAIQRLAQMARAAGIHIIMATQRPSVDVITGTIKANFPTRISFQVTSKIDSRTILGEAGAEQLLGRGDMLYMAGGGRITRVHGPFVSDEEVERVVSFWKTRGEPDYIDDITEDDEAQPDAIAGEDADDSGDTLYRQAVAVVCRERKASTSFVQRQLQIGYNRAARIIERMEAEGVVSAANHVGKREVLAGGGD
jgi:S-DNA-T family DNA segregation ATPase FtsK/SpoIIIE